MSERSEAKRSEISQLMWCCWLASLLEDEHTRDGSREMAADIMATSTAELTLFHSIRFFAMRSKQLAGGKDGKANPQARKIRKLMRVFFFGCEAKRSEAKRSEAHLSLD